MQAFKCRWSMIDRKWRMCSAREVKTRDDCWIRATQVRIISGNPYPYILGAVLCHLWWSGNSELGESPAALKASHTAQDLPFHYSMMLSVEVFAQYHHHVEAGSIVQGGMCALPLFLH